MSSISMLKPRIASLSTLVSPILTALLFLAAPTPAAAANGILYAFGDSAIDTGNILIVTSGATPDPAAGYWEGRFCDGLNYLDRVAAASPNWACVPALAQGTNGAFGGGESGPGYSTKYGTPNLQEQIGLFMQEYPGLRFAERDVILISSGHNDLLSHLASPPPTATIVQYIMESVAALADIGGRVFVIPTTIPIQYSPAVQGSQESTPQQVQTWLTAFNASLTAELAAYAAADQRLTIIRTDLFTKTTDIYANPASYGLTDVTRPSYDGQGDPETSLWFDACHVTSKVSTFLADGVVNDLKTTYGPLAPGVAPAVSSLLLQYD